MQTARKLGCDRDRQRTAWDLIGETDAQWREKLLLWCVT